MQPAMALMVEVDLMVSYTCGQDPYHGNKDAKEQRRITERMEGLEAD
jgi:hypothetical protein